MGLISAAALAYEILLMRLFSIIQWHHFAYMIISLALLGYAASGTFLALTQTWWSAHFRLAYVASAALFSVTAMLCFLLAQSVPFNALEVIWDMRQPFWLLLIYLLLLLPFFFAANCICMTFGIYRDQLHRIYCVDLLGAGAGAVGVIALLFVLMPEQALWLISLLGLISAAAAVLELGLRHRWWIPLLACAVFLTLLKVEPKVSQFKGLSQALRVTGSTIVDQRSSPLGQLTTVENPVIPFRHAPGLSLNTPAEPMEQKAVFTDSDGLSVITRFKGSMQELEYLNWLSSALPYQLLDQPTVLVLGAGGGVEVLQALSQDARQVDALELNPQMVELVNETFGDFSGRLFSHPRVRLHRREARGFIDSSNKAWDLIQLALLDSFNASSAGLYALNESYLYTVEAFGIFLDHLTPAGMLSVTRWIKLPPRDGLKLLATAIKALEQSGVHDPGRHLILIRSWNTSTLLVAKQPITDKQISGLKEFSKTRWFDLAWYPGMAAVEANLYNQLREPWFHQGAMALLGPGREQFIANYKFNIQPATDDRPHFFRFLIWRSLPEILLLRGRGGLPLLEQGYLVLVATLVQAVLVSLVMVLLPLVLARRRKLAGGQIEWRALVYFLAVGLAFMLIEIAFIQKFILFLSHPLYAVAVVLSAFLVFAGLGSMAAGKWISGRHANSIIVRAVVGISVLTMLYLVMLPILFHWLMPLNDIYRIVISAILIAPLAFLMGMPFPTGLSKLDAQMIPWAWGVNGCASVIAAVLATMLAIHVGFNVVIVLSLALYILAALLSSAFGTGLQENGDLPIHE